MVSPNLSFRIPAKKDSALTSDFRRQSRSSVYAPIMEEKLTRVHPHGLAIYTKNKRQKPLKMICRMCELLSICCIYHASRLPKADEMFPNVLKLI